VGEGKKLFNMSKTKRHILQPLYLLISAFALILIIHGCNVQNEATPDATIPLNENNNDTKNPEINTRQEVPNLHIDDFAEQAEPLHIGILQFAEHSALDAVHSGMLDALEAAGLKQDLHINIDYYNSQGNPHRCQATIEQFVEDSVDLIVAIATPSAQAAVEQKEIPVLFAAVTEPQKAGLIETWEEPNTNATGVSDLNPIEALLDMTMEVVPEVENIGVVYNDTEVNSVIQVELSRQIAEDLGVNIVKASAENPEEVGTMAEKLVNEVDVIWIPTDNTVLAAFDKLIKIMERDNIPVVGASTEFAMQGAMYATGYDYYVIGLQAGDMAVEVISGTDPSVMPVQMSSDIHIAINMQSAKEIGYRIPFEVLLITDQIYFE